MQETKGNMQEIKTFKCN